MLYRHSIRTNQASYYTVIIPVPGPPPREYHHLHPYPYPPPYPLLNHLRYWNATNYSNGDIDNNNRKKVPNNVDIRIYRPIPSTRGFNDVTQLNESEEDSGDMNDTNDFVENTQIYRTQEATNNIITNDAEYKDDAPAKRSANGQTDSSSRQSYRLIALSK